MNAAFIYESIKGIPKEEIKKLYKMLDNDLKKAARKTNSEKEIFKAKVLEAMKRNKNNN